MFYDFAANSIVNPLENIVGVKFSLHFATDLCLSFAANAHGEHTPEAIKLEGMWHLVFKPSDVLRITFQVKFFDNSFTDGKLITKSGKWMRFTIVTDPEKGKFLFIS